jgi:hypothetical protein
MWAALRFVQMLEARGILERVRSSSFGGQFGKWACVYFAALAASVRGLKIMNALQRRAKIEPRPAPPVKQPA